VISLNKSKEMDRICIKDFTVMDIDSREIFTIERGKEYLTSDIGAAPAFYSDLTKKGCVVVFSTYWVSVPIEHFAGEQQFT